jgi:tRNA pseudouridine38-40 synthase
MRIALGLEYDGAAFCGWQTQPGRCAVQDALETALAAIAGHPVDTVCAGRTDAGVHGACQVVHFDTSSSRPLSAWTRGANTHLPPSVSVLWARQVSEDFHARFSARTRTYRYLLLARGVRPGLDRGRVGWTHWPLDPAAMAEGAAHLVGEHDFSAFRAAECQAASPVRQLSRLDVQERAGLIAFDLTANAFLQHMVRNIVGCLVEVGAGRQPPDWVASVLAGRDRRLAAPTFAADGLYLCEVDYDAGHDLPRLARWPGPFPSPT